MAKNIFISYSRREVGFVDDLVSQLESKQYEVWLDYRKLVPGSPWQDQIYKGINDADVILLLVSKASLASQNVEVEWRKVLEQKKRIILLIFEAVDLPPELEKYEWVDFRGNYQAGLDELFSQLEKPVQEDHPVPQTGFKIPVIVWVAAGLSVIVAFLSFSAFWTLFIPWLLVLLPYRIFKRDFNFTQVQTSLWILPLALFLSATIASDNDRLNAIMSEAICSIPLVFILIFVLRSAAMQRWGKEQATMPKFSNPYKPENPHPTPVSFYVDFAPEDRKIADELVRVLKKYDHVQAEKIDEAKAVFVLLSHFKSDTTADPEKQVVFPVVIQTGEVSSKLSKVQWIDMRTGVRGLNAIAQLLPEPDKLLRALGNRPRGNQLILPAPIMAMYYFLILIGVFAMGGLFKLFFGIFDTGDSAEILASVLGGVFIPFVITIALLGWAIYSMLRALIQRTGKLASFWRFTFSLAWVGLLLGVEFLMGGNIIGAITEVDPNANISAVGSVIYPLLVYGVGVVVMAVFLFFRRRDIMFWFPSKK